MSEFTITTAERKASPVSVFMEGESGSGKTYSALLLARGLAGPGGKIGIIDTEGGRSLIYADDPDIGGFEHLEFRPPYSPDRCIQAFKAAQADGWKALVFDSASLEHDGEGGLLDMAEEEGEKLLAKNPNNRGVSQQKWTQPKLAHKRFLNFAVGMPIHVIMAFRQTLTTDFESKPPRTVLTTVCEKNTRFALELHCTLAPDHKAHWSRLPKPYIPCVAQDAVISTETGSRLADSCGSAVAQPSAQPASPDTDREEAIREINVYLDSEGIDVAYFNAAIERATKGEFSDFEKLPDERIAKLAVGKNLAKMADLAKSIAEGGAA